MAKRKITVTVDEALVEFVRADDESLSAVVNAALMAEVAKRARHKALVAMLDDLDARFGPVSAEVLDTARAAFDELDAVATSS